MEVRGSRPNQIRLTRSSRHGTPLHRPSLEFERTRCYSGTGTFQHLRVEGLFYAPDQVPAMVTDGQGADMPGLQLNKINNNNSSNYKIRIVTWLSKIKE